LDRLRVPGVVMIDHEDPRGKFKGEIVRERVVSAINLPDQ
jgi:hypothetical protein